MGVLLKTNGGVTAPRGFSASGVSAHVKYQDRKDFAMIVSDRDASAAGVFTTNAVAAAPVRLDKALLRNGVLRAVAVNTGFANACTGETGEQNARKTAELVAKALSISPDHVAVCSTGVIGVNLPMDRIAKGVELASRSLASTPEAAADAAEAIKTTDTVSKQAARSFAVDGVEIRLGGMCKGAGMIEPYMATMLGFVTTDAAVSPADLHEALVEAANVSFNRIVIDNDRSTNDTLLVLANGASGVSIAKGTPAWDTFREALKEVCVDLARQMVMDGEGVSKFVTLNVTGATNDADAQTVARSIARSMLVKTSWYGMDPNWGRVLAAAGYSGAPVEERLARVFYGDIAAFDRGQVADGQALASLKEIMKARSFTVTVDLGLGDGACTLYTSDLTHQYVTINADYTT